MAEEYTVAHTGSVLGDGMVTLEQNQTTPEPRRDSVIAFECPDKFERLEYNGPEHPIRFQPRTMQEATMADDDGDGDLSAASDRTIALNNSIQTVAGEDELDEQPYPAVEAVNVTQGTEIGTDELTVDYNTNEVTIAESAVAVDDDVKVYPILAEGDVKWGGRNALGQDEGVANQWPMPLFRWHDMEQIRAGREITMDAQASWSHNENLELRLESEHPIVWEDADYPGAYVSELELDLRIHL